MWTTSSVRGCTLEPPSHRAASAAATRASPSVGRRCRQPRHQQSISSTHSACPHFSLLYSHHSPPLPARNPTYIICRSASLATLTSVADRLAVRTNHFHDYIFYLWLCNNRPSTDNWMGVGGSRSTAVRPDVPPGQKPFDRRGRGQQARVCRGHCHPLNLPIGRPRSTEALSSSSSSSQYDRQGLRCRNCRC